MLEALWHILNGAQRLDEQFFDGGAFLFLIHLLEFMATFGVAFLAARKLYKRRVEEVPPQMITRAGDNSRAFLEAMHYFVKRVGQSTSLLLGVIFVLVSLFLFYIVIGVAIEHGDAWWETLKDNVVLLGLAIVIGGFGIFSLRDA